MWYLTVFGSATHSYTEENVALRPGYIRFPESLQNHSRFIPESFQNHFRIIPGSLQNHYRIIPESCQNHARASGLGIPALGIG